MVLRLRVAVLCLAAVCSSLDRPAAAAASVGAAATDPAAFYVDLDIRGTVNGLRRRKMGIVTLRFNPSWAPNGARRIRQLLGAKYYDGTKFFEVLDGTKSGGVKTVQGGIQGNPAVGKPWRKKPIEDEPWPAAVPGLSNRKGTLALVPTPPGGGDADSARSTQFIIHLSDNGKAYDGGGGDDATGAALVPLGEVVSGLEVLETLLEQHSQQAEAAAAAAGETGSEGGGAMAAEDIQKIYEQGDRFLDRHNGDLAFIHSARYNKKFKKQADAKEL